MNRTTGITSVSSVRSVSPEGQSDPLLGEETTCTKGTGLGQSERVFWV